jgi:hypothetical protein
MRKALGKQQLCELLDDLIDVRCDGKLIIIPLSPVLPHPLVLMLQMTREALRVELVDNHHLSAAAEREDEMEDGACCNVELACGLVVWPVRVHVQVKKRGVKISKKRVSPRDQRTFVGHRR